MATAVSSKPPNGPRLKRPPPAPVQTGVNGTKPSGGAQSPNVASKRPPNGTNSSTNGATPTSAGGANKPNPVRRPSGKPGDAQLRQSRPARPGEANGVPLQRPPEPLVKTTEYILKKYAKKPPSLVIHLHPTYFRFEQQDGSFSYNSSMNVILKHVRQQTVPQELVEELLKSNVPFYENSLIVQVHDHRREAASNTSTSKEVQKENQPFSIHKPNKFTVPSPYGQFPLPKQLSPDAPDKNGASSQSDAEKENTQASSNSDASKSATGTKIFTTVLFSTPTAISQELTVFAQLVDTVLYARTRKAVAQKNGPAAAAAMSGVPPPKRQKILNDYSRLQEAESKLIHAMAPPLYLDPADSMDEVQHLLKQFKDPLHSEAPPAPKSRKRTIAELAADEALFAEEQRYMLIMDERLQPSAASASADGDTGGANFEPSFDKFKLIEQIRKTHEERRQQEQEAKEARAAQQLAAQQAEKERQALLNQQLRAQQIATAQNMHANRHVHPQANGPANAQHAAAAAAARANQASPPMRNVPAQMASSPVAGQAMVPSRSTQGGVAMAVTSSAQGSGSPTRPSSAVHAHPMVPPQQPPSRNGTPQVPGGTPRMQNSTPVMNNNMTSTPHMGHASPSMASTAATPVMGNNMISTPQLGNRQMTAQQFHQQQQQAMMIQQRAQQAMQARANQGSPPNMAMSPHTSQYQQQMAARVEQLARQRQMTPQQLQALQQMRMSAGGQAGNMTAATAAAVGMQAPNSGLANQMNQQRMRQMMQANAQHQQQQRQILQQQQAAGMTQQQLQDMNMLMANFSTQLRQRYLASGHPLTPELESRIRLQARNMAINQLRPQAVNGMPSNGMGMNGMG